VLLPGKLHVDGCGVVADLRVLPADLAVDELACEVAVLVSDEYVAITPDDAVYRLLLGPFARVRF